MQVLWSQRVEGDAFRGLVIESDRACVSTGRQTLVVSRGGEVLDRCEPPLARNNSRWSVWLGESRYEMADGYLIEFDAKGIQNRRVEIQRDQFKHHRESFVRRFAEWTPSVAHWTDHHIRNWWRSVYLTADSARGRLYAIGRNVPWLAAVRTDGCVDWVRLLGFPADCCSSADVVAGDGTLAHFSSCGQRITFVTKEGEIVSAHGIEGPAGHLLTNRRGVAYVTIFDEGIRAYRPTVGLTNIVGIPRLHYADLKDGILYVVSKDRSDSFVLEAFQEPA